MSTRAHGDGAYWAYTPTVAEFEGFLGDTVRVVQGLLPAATRKAPFVLNVYVHGGMDPVTRELMTELEWLRFSSKARAKEVAFNTLRYLEGHIDFAEVTA